MKATSSCGRWSAEIINLLYEILTMAQATLPPGEGQPQMGGVNLEFAARCVMQGNHEGFARAAKQIVGLWSPQVESATYKRVTGTEITVTTGEYFLQILQGAIVSTNAQLRGEGKKALEDLQKKLSGDELKRRAKKLSDDADKLGDGGLPEVKDTGGAKSKGWWASHFGREGGGGRKR